MTRDDIIRILPKGKRKNLDPNIVKKIVDISENSDVAKEFRENFVTYVDVIMDGRWSVEDYHNAILFVTYKLLGAKDIDAYARVFPDRYQSLVDRGYPPDRISSWVSNYKNNKLVSKIMEQTLVPTWVANAPYFQEAINFEVELMRNEMASWTVRQKAADSLLTHLARPEAVKMELDIGVKQDSIVEEYEENIRRLVEMQKQLIDEGADVKAVANAGILPKYDDAIDAEVENG